MGTSVWVLRRDAVDQEDDFDHSKIFDVSEQLDQVAAGLGVRKVSEFFDWTDFDASMSSDGPLEDYEYIASAKWFDPQEAIPALEALLTHLKDDPGAVHFGESPEVTTTLVQELEDVLSKVKRAASDGSTFNLCVVM
ncbi:MAG TPA: hypothetical protein VIA64_03080 [Burkholderiales bacterium]|jgi:hypothetical protein